MLYWRRPRTQALCWSHSCTDGEAELHSVDVGTVKVVVPDDETVIVVLGGKGFRMSPSRYPSAPRSLVAVVTRPLNGNQLVPSNLSKSEKVGGEDDDEVLDAMYNVEGCRQK